MADGVFLVLGNLSERAFKTKLLRHEHGVVTKALAAAQLVPNAAFDRALDRRFVSRLVDECERTHEASRALLVGHIGKLVKLAGGMWNTHSKCGDCRMELIAAHAAALGLPPARVEEVLDCATCDDALRILKEEQLYDAVLARLAERIEFHLAHKCGEMAAGAIVFSKEYGLLCRTSRAQELLGTIMEG